MSFVDRVDIWVKAGDGGDGCMSFRREKYVPKGGPDGGDGGNGGQVVIRAADGVNGLLAMSYKRHWKAERGEHGLGKNMTGASGADIVIAVPPGTVVRDRDAGFVLRDLVAPGQEIVVARGGKGGRGNAAFTTSTNRAPRERERGGEGEERWLSLEIKLIADVGVVGLPNAGKSTLLSVLSRATPQIADYPFTTKYPNLGVVQVDEDRSFVLADIPGLIEGAHAGVGLGHEFLRHVERTRLLVHLLDCQPQDGTHPLDNYRTIRRELELYRHQLAEKPEMVVLSKCELMDAEPLRQEMEAALGVPVWAISAAARRNTRQLVQEIHRTLQSAPTVAAPAPTAAFAFGPADPTWDPDLPSMPVRAVGPAAPET